MESKRLIQILFGALVEAMKDEIRDQEAAYLATDEYVMELLEKKMKELGRKIVKERLE